MPSNNNLNHSPSTPSGLRQSYTASSSDTSHTLSSPASPEQARSGPSRNPSETTGLLSSDELYGDHAHEGPCDHGTFSPRPGTPSTIGRQHGSRNPSPGESSESSLPIIDSVVAFVAAKGAPDWRKKWARRMRSKTMSTSSELAERHGVKDSAFMCVYATSRLIFPQFGLQLTCVPPPGISRTTCRASSGCASTSYLSLKATS